MEIFLAGTLTGNMSPAINDFHDRNNEYYNPKKNWDDAMKLYLAGNPPWAEQGIYEVPIVEYKPYILDSYYYLKKKRDLVKGMLPFYEEFILDSGAFSFLNGVKGTADWDSYIEDYADFINDCGIDNFIELDIDSLVGIKEVERLRAKLEALTGKQCMPVFHKSRGLAYWKKMIKDYEYVCIGGIVTKEILPKDYDIFGALITMANKEGTRVHGLGFTRIPGLKKYKFHSVDSTAWLYGNRAGFLYNFTGNDLKKIEYKGKHIIQREVAVHNFTEWCKFQRWAKKNL